MDPNLNMKKVITDEKLDPKMEKITMDIKNMNIQDDEETTENHISEVRELQPLTANLLDNLLKSSKYFDHRCTVMFLKKNKQIVDISFDTGELTSKHDNTSMKFFGYFDQTLVSTNSRADLNVMCIEDKIPKQRVIPKKNVTQLLCQLAGIARKLSLVNIEPDCICGFVHSGFSWLFVERNVNNRGEIVYFFSETICCVKKGCKLIDKENLILVARLLNYSLFITNNVLNLIEMNTKNSLNFFNNSDFNGNYDKNLDKDDDANDDEKDNNFHDKSKKFNTNTTTTQNKINTTIAENSNNSNKNTSKYNKKNNVSYNADNKENICSNDNNNNNNNKENMYKNSYSSKFKILTERNLNALGHKNPLFNAFK
jgi:hypothetical protein